MVLSKYGAIQVKLRKMASKTKEMLISFKKKTSWMSPVDIQGLDIELVASYKHLC